MDHLKVDELYGRQYLISHTIITGPSRTTGSFRTGELAESLHVPFHTSVPPDHIRHYPGLGCLIRLEGRSERILSAWISLQISFMAWHSLGINPLQSVVRNL